MKKQFLLLLFLASAWVLNAQNNRKIAESKIDKVTVYLDGAQVSRSAKTNLAAGKTEVVFQGLSPYLDKSSISVEAKGGFTVASVTWQPNHLNEQKKKDETEALEKQKDSLTKKREDIENQKSVYEEGVTMLEKNQGVNSAHTDLKVDELKAAMDFHLERLTELKKNILAFERQSKSLDDSIQKLNAQLATINAGHDAATSDLVIAIEAKQGGEANFNVSYFVNYAGWFPTYDLKVDDISKPMNILYRANVHQNTGEDWNDVKLTLSNGEPKVSGVKPVLNPWYLSTAGGTYKNNYYYNPYSGRVPDPNVTEVKGKVYDDHGAPLLGATIILKGSTIGTTSDFDGNYSLKIPPSSANYLRVSYIGYNTQDIPVFSNLINIRMSDSQNELNEVVVTGSKYKESTSMETLQSEGISTFGGEERAERQKTAPVYNVATNETFSPTTYQYEIQAPYNIPADGKTYAVDIKQQDIPADYLYVTVPKIDKTAYLTARITGWEDYNLLDGEANLYFEGTYLGKTLLSTSTAEDTIEISLGRDKSVTVNRTKVKDFSKKTFFGDKKIASRYFEISVRNNKKEPINIMVLDQFPVSTQKEIEVDKLEYKEASLDDATGKLTWNLQISPATETKVGFKYAVKYPKNYHLQLE
ncbi:MAG TPA: mucoidy inhibitor MuiA family protein [Chitinophagales bacterium]|nr:mucoidy inhibitor MuiA family protein [Chitinophagales bacterium]